MPVSAGTSKPRAPRNRTLEVAKNEAELLRPRLVFDVPTDSKSLKNKVVCGDAFEVLRRLPAKNFDLLFADPPYNLDKAFGTERFRERSLDDYESWLNTWLELCFPLLRSDASVYICGDWRSAAAIQRVGMKYFRLQNRITWEREKGRGAKRNWKNTAEDIWFFTVSEDFTFNVEDVKIKRKVLAPYKVDGKPKDWDKSENGNFRVTHPSNIWTDVSVPFWSMPENTDHPTQKPEKLLAKIILASTNAGDLVLDPFAGSGTTAVVAKKLGRGFVAVEADEQYCLLAQKRLELCEREPAIQGYDEGVFWERNSGR